MIKYVVIGVGVIAVGVAVYALVHRMNSEQNVDGSKILQKCFGAPMYASTFSMAEVRDWLKSRESVIKTGAKGLVIKVNPKTLTKIGQNINLDAISGNNLLIAVIDTATNDIKDSVLIKYDKLDDKLESLLQTGDGVLVVEA